MRALALAVCLGFLSGCAVVMDRDPSGLNPPPGGWASDRQDIGRR